MARKPRQELEPGVFHVYARGNAKELIFLDDVDRLTYLERLCATAAFMDWRCLSYCLMNNHVHLLVETRNPNLGAGMGRFHGSYAQRFNLRHHRVGHLFQGRYGAVRVESDEQFRAAAVYIARNPVEAALCSRAEKWPWSSFAATCLDAAPDWLCVNRLLEFFGDEGVTARNAFASLVRGTVPSGGTVPAEGTVPSTIRR